MVVDKLRATYVQEDRTISNLFQVKMKHFRDQIPRVVNKMVGHTQPINQMCLQPKKSKKQKEFKQGKKFNYAAS